MLRRAVRSALAQTHPEVEVRVYDNASGDDTSRVIEEFHDPRLHYHAHAENLGSFANFRYGVEHVATPFFSILADDDYLLPDFHRLALERFEEEPDLMAVALDCLFVDEHDRVFRHGELGPGTYRPPQALLEMLRQGHLNWTSVLFRREAIGLIGGLDPAAALYLDFDVLVRLAARAPIAVRPELGAVYLNHEGAVSSSASVEADRWVAFAAIIDKVAGDSELPPDVRAEAGRLLHLQFRGNLWKAGIGAARRGNRAAALGAASELVRLGFRSRAAAVQLAAAVGRSAAGRALLGLAAWAARPYSGETVGQVLRAAG